MEASHPQAGGWQVTCSTAKLADGSNLKKAPFLFQCVVEAENACVKAKQRSQAENLKESESHTFSESLPNCQIPPSPSPGPAHPSQTTLTPKHASDGAHSHTL